MFFLSFINRTHILLYKKFEMFFILASISLLLSVSAYSPIERTFSVNHFYGKTNLVTARMDPITYPGVPSSHVHVVQGGNAFAMAMTDNQALNSTCTSSLVKNDKSNYWTPALYFQDPQTGDFESVDLFYMQVYYFFEATTDVIKAFPPGLRILSGDSSLRSPPETGITLNTNLADGPPQPVQWTCPRSDESSPLYPVDSDGLHGVGIQDPRTKSSGVGFPDQNCDGYSSPLRADIHFPSCYNPAAGLADYKKNMQFTTNGNCPQGWIHVPHLFYEVYWDTPKFSNRWTPGQGKQPFVLSNGDSTGYSLHGDFISGWDVETLQQIIDNCNTGTSAMDKCPGLIGGLEDPSTTCTIPNPFPNEKVAGRLQSLPGNNPVTSWGSTNSQAQRQKLVISREATPIFHMPNSRLLPVTNSTRDAGDKDDDLKSDWTYLGCFADDNYDSHLVSFPLNQKGHAVNNKRCVDLCDEKGYSIAGTKKGRWACHFLLVSESLCFCSDSIAQTKNLQNESCDVVCEGDSEQICGGFLASSVYVRYNRVSKMRHRQRKLSLLRTSPHSSSG